MYIYNGILFSHEKERNPAICNNMDEFGGHKMKYTRQRKTNTIWYHLYEESKQNKKCNSQKQRVEWQFPEAVGWGKQGDVDPGVQTLFIR